VLSPRRLEPHVDELAGPSAVSDRTIIELIAATVTRWLASRADADQHVYESGVTVADGASRHGVHGDRTTRSTKSDSAARTRRCGRRSESDGVTSARTVPHVDELLGELARTERVARGADEGELSADDRVVIGARHRQERRIGRERHGEGG
jgi:transposase-like protein